MLFLMGVLTICFLELTAIFHRYDINKPAEMFFLGATMIFFLLFLYKLHQT